MNIPIKVKKRILTCNKTLVANNVETYIADFQFDEEWESFAKVATFYNDSLPTDEKNPITVTLENTSVDIPWEVLQEPGYLYVAVKGVKDSEVVVTKLMDAPIAVYESGKTLGSESHEPTPDVVEQILSEAQEAKNIAEEVQRRADSGAFDGEDGADGKDGTDGNGIDRIEKVSTSGLVDTYRIYFTDGSTYDYTVTNGEDRGTRDYNELENKPFKYLDLSESNIKINELENGNYIISGNGNIYDPNGNKILQEESLGFTLLIGDRIYKSDNGAEITIQDGTYYSLDFTNFSYYMTKAGHDTDINAIKSKKQDKLSFTGNISLTGEDNNIPNADIPTKISEFENDSNYQSGEQVKNTVSPVADDLANYLEVADAIGLWKTVTANITNFDNMFQGRTDITKIPELDMSSATSAKNLCNGCSNLKSFVNRTTSNVTKFYSAFKGCSSAETIDIDTSRNTQFNGMFWNCSSLKELNIDMSRAVGMDYMCRSCTSLESIKTVDFTGGSPAASGKNYLNMFTNCTNLIHIEIVPESIKGNLSFVNSSKLDSESVASIFNGLADMSEYDTHTLTLHADVQITQAQADAAVAKNWNIVGGTVNG